MIEGVIPIVKCVGFGCNLKCDYCFYRKEPNKVKIMSPLVLESLIRETYQKNQHEGPVTFIWHGGEPMLVERKFFRQVVDFQKKYNRRNQVTVNGIQTNGMLINRAWAEFFKEYNFQVGVSLDGPREFHDYYRKYPSGKGSFDNVMRSIETLKEYRMPFGIVVVVTDKSVRYPEKMFRFFLDNRLYNLKLSRALGENIGKGGEFALHPQKYGEFLLKILRLWLEEDNPQYRISPIVEIFSSVLEGKSSSECFFAGTCSQFWVINADGGIYTCPSEGAGEQGKIGDVSEGIDAVINSESFMVFREYIRNIKEKCQDCKWYEICKGGCTRNYEDGRNVLCDSLRRLFEEAEKELCKYGLIQN